MARSLDFSHAAVHLTIYPGSFIIGFIPKQSHHPALYHV